MKGGVVGRKGDPDCNLHFPNCLRVSCPWNIDYCCLTGNRNSLVSFYMGLERSLYCSPSSVLGVTCAPLTLRLPHRRVCLPYLERGLFPELQLHACFVPILTSCPQKLGFIFTTPLKKKRACCTSGEYNLALLSSPKAISRVTLCNG